MQKKILEFTNILRKSGIRVSPAESIDAFAALDDLSVEDREIFQDALRATMVKRGEEVPTFDELFDLFWSGFYDNLRDSFAQATGELGEMGVDFETLVQQIVEMLNRGKILPSIHQTFPLEKAADAHRAIDELNFFGKLVLTVP